MITRLHVCLLTSGKVFDIAYGGEERFSTSLGNWLVSKGHDVTLMGSTFASVKAMRLSKSNIEEYKERITNQKKVRELYPPYTIYALSRLVMSLQWFLKILSINRRSSITLIHAQDTGYSGLAAVVSGKLLGIPVIISSHGIRHKSLESSLHGKFKKVLIKLEYNLDIFTIKNASRILADNPSIKNYFEQIISKKIDVIPIPIKLKNFEYSQVNRDLVRREMGVDEDTKIIGFVGRFEEEKNLNSLLISFADLTREEPSIKLVLVGTGSLESQLREYVSKRGIGKKVIFCGVRYDIGRILSSFDIFVLPSYIEGLSTALLEAMTSGRAIVCSEIPANLQVVTHNQEALLVNPHDREGLKRAIQTLVNDDSLRLKLGSNAKIRASQYNEDIIFPKILQCYETLSGGKRRKY